MTRTTIRSEDITAGQVKAADLASDAVDTTGIQTDIAILGFKVAANGSLAKYDLVDQTIDAFEDASGVDASASTNETRNASNYYSGTGTVTPTITEDADSTGTDGSYSWYKWTATGSGSYQTDTAQDHEYLVIAGGGGGGEGYYGGGGGAGGYRNSTSSETTGGGGSAEAALSLVADTSYTATVGGGGAGSAITAGKGVNGSDSVFATITASGGGGGNSRGATTAASDGGSGGAAALYTNATDGGQAVSPTQGYDGGDCPASVSGAGGGGAGAVGSDGIQLPNPGAASGGAGLSSSIDGSATTRGGGGGGGGWLGTGAGGAGGGGTGGQATGGGATGPTAGTANKGGGGGGGGADAEAGAAGGSGLVVIRRLTAATVYLDLTLVSNATTAEAEPTKGDLVMTYTNGAGTATINTDIKGWVSRDDGTTYTQFTLADDGDTGGHTILTAHDLDISGQPSGTSMRYKITTHNQSVSKQTRIQAVSLGWS